MDAFAQLASLMASRSNSTQEPSEMHSLSDRVRLMSQSAGISTLTTIQSEEEIPPTPGEDEVHALPIEEDGPIGIPTMNWFAELLGRLREVKLDPDPRKVTKQIMEVVRSLRTPEGELVFPSLGHETQALDVCYLLLKKEEEENNPVAIQPVPDEVGISGADDEMGILPVPEDVFTTQPVNSPTLKEAIWIARIQLFGVGVIYDEMRIKTFFPDADTFGSANFDY